MINSLDPASERFLASLAATNRRLEVAQRQIASGRRMLTASDDPDQIGALLQTRAELRQTEQTRQNLGRVEGEVDAAEQALQQAALLLDRAQALGAQGASGTQTAESRAILAGEVTSLLEQLVALSQTTVEDRYIFSGDLDQVAPYALDWSLDPSLSSYQGSTATRKTMHPSGTVFAVAHSADQIFDNSDPGKNVFSAVNDLRVALSGNDEAGARAALARLRGASSHLNSELGFYGSVQNQVKEAIDSAHKSELRIQSRLSAIEDADLTAAILEMNQAQFQREASLNSRAKMPRTSLFDYLK